MNEEQEKAFVLALTELTRKHGIAIGGCGCCGSPFLVDADVSDPRAGYCGAENLRWIEPGDKHDWEKYEKDIVKA